MQLHRHEHVNDYVLIVHIRHGLFREVCSKNVPVPIYSYDPKLEIMSAFHMHGWTWDKEPI